MRTRRFIYIFLALSLVSITGAAFISKRRPRVSCYPSAFVSPSHGEKQYLSPQKIVVKPWRGQHNVYGVFMVPKGYQSDKLLTLTLPDNKTYCGQVVKVHGDSWDKVEAKPGYYLMRGYLNTRVALFLIAQGKIEELKQPQNWKLGYVSKT